MGDVPVLSLARLREALASGDLEAAEVISAHRERAHTADRLNAFTEIVGEPSGGPGPLAGVPVAVKDVFVDGGRAPTMGSKVHPSGMEGTATVFRRLREAGAAVIGYTNLHEWGIGTTSTVTATGPIRNPWDRSRIAGGSSGGSAAAVAAGVVPVAIGTDAGGSIRIPAACCGVVGLKPTFGAIPLDGDVAGSSPINHAGVIARTVDDVATVFEVLAQERVEDVETERVVVGVPSNFFFDDLNEDLAAVAEDTARLLGRAQHGVRSITVPDVESSAQTVSRTLLPHVAGLVASGLEERPGDFDPWTLKVLQRGAAMERRPLDLAPFRTGWDHAFGSCDLVVVPTLPALPPRIDDHKIQLPSGRAVADLAQFALNAPMNTGGVPALSVPCGVIDGLPVSVTLVAQRGQEALLLSAGRLLEDALDGVYRDRVAPSEA